MSINDIPSKPRRKKLEVPIHKCTEHQDNHKKTFSANFNFKKHRNKSDEDKVQTEVIVEIPETDRTNKIRKKHLLKENLRLNDENKELFMKFHELEDLSVKKITKLKERIGTLQDEADQIRKDNEDLKVEYKNLLMHCDDLENRLASSRICKSCEDFKTNLEQYQVQNNLLRSNNKELSEDLNMLKVVIFRLNVQLERYQETLRKHNFNIPVCVLEDINENSKNLRKSDENFSNEILSNVHKTHRHTAISWGSVNTHTLGPLLDAYEDTIREKDEIIQNYETELYKFTGKLKEIVDENESLYVKLKEDEGCSVKLKIELNNVKLELNSTKQQNDVLIKKCALKQDKVEEILNVYEAKVNQIKRDFEVLHQEYIKCRTENATLKERNNSFLGAQEEFKNQMQNYIPLSVHTASVNECKKWYEELKSQYENEKEKLLKNIELHIKTIDEMKNETRDLKSTKESLQAKIVLLEKQIKKLETRHLELEHTLNEVQLSRSALRKQLHKAMGFAKDMVAEQETLLRALNQRQLENKVVKKIGSDMASRMDSLKHQLKDVQRNAWQEFTTVEKTIQEQADLIETMKQEHEREIEKLTKIINNQEETNLLLKNDNVPMSHYLLFKDKYK